jgi:tRNA threonylcarbamoyladenosine biosynthesis protein TsaE
METFIYNITSVTDLTRVTETVLAHARMRAVASPHQATVCAFSGDLGTGKTTFIQSLARSLGVAEIVTSPTFVVMKQYETSDETFAELVHIDAYRIEDVDEMRPLGFSALLLQPRTLICIEWAERVATLLPADAIVISLELHPDETRTLTITS